MCQIPLQVPWPQLHFWTPATTGGLHPDSATRVPSIMIGLAAYMIFGENVLPTLLLQETFRVRNKAVCQKFLSPEQKNLLTCLPVCLLLHV